MKYFCLLFGIVFLAGCASPSAPSSASPEPTTNVQLQPSASVALSPTPPAGSTEHRIATRPGDSGMEFYDRLTGKRFVVRGANYHRWVTRFAAAGKIQADALFNTSFGELDLAETDLQQIADLGFNTVRVWRNACWGGVGGCIGDPSGGLSSEYLDNVAEFLCMAQRHGIYVIFTDDWIPDDGGYSQILNRGCCAFDGYNNVYLTKYGIEAEKRYWSDFIQGLLDRRAPMDAILAYELKNEAFYEAQLPPLSKSSGSVTTANGKTYDMANAKDRQRMMEDGWLYWSEQLRNSILAIDPTALVTMGFFVQKEPNLVMAGDPRLVYLEHLVRESSLDFIDFHAYPGYDLSIRQHAENLAMIGAEDKLIVMGEFGADKRNFPSPEQGAAVLQAWQASSCDFGFDGWLLWTWGPNPNDEYWTALEGGGVVSQALSPVHRPDPCSFDPPVPGYQNLALLKTATASRSENDIHGPDKANDGSIGTWWSAASGPPQWIEIDLQEPQTIGRVILQPGWVAALGKQHIRVSVRGPGTNNEYQLLHEFDQPVEHPVPLEFILDHPMAGIQYIKVETVAADGWVVWPEIEVFP